MSGFYLIPKPEYDKLLRGMEELRELFNTQVIGGVRLQDWIDERQAQALLGLKTTTLWALRKTGELTFSRIGNKIFYSVESINKLLNKNSKR